MELDVVWRTSDLRLCRHFGLTKLHGSILIQDQGIKRPFGDVHANCTAYTVGLIAVDSHRLKEKNLCCSSFHFWMVQICSDNVQVWCVT